MDVDFYIKKYPYLVNSIQKDPTSNFIDYYIVNYEATSMRQSAEWGMRAFQSSFPRVKDTLRFEEKGERKLIWRSLILLYNLRVKHVGINQIRNTYMPWLEKDANKQFVNPLLNGEN